MLGSEGASLGHTVLPMPSGTRSPTGWPAVQAGVSTERRRPVCVRQSRRKPKAWRVNVWGAEPRTEAVVSLQCRRSREHPGTQPPGPPPSWSSFAARSPRVAWEGTGGRGPGLLRSPRAAPGRFRPVAPPHTPFRVLVWGEGQDSVQTHLNCTRHRDCSSSTARGAVDPGHSPRRTAHGLSTLMALWKLLPRQRTGPAAYGAPGSPTVACFLKKN